MTGGPRVIRAYREALQGASALWHDARGGSHPDPAAARAIVASLAAALDEDAAGLIALTDTDGGDTVVAHMVNVAALTLLQTQSFGIRGPLRDLFGLAALLHDIGTVNTPPEILGKSGPLTAAELAIAARHVVDGERILRRTPGMPRLAALVAFEHHVKNDRSGYPEGISRPLNVCTLLVSIADVFDALKRDRRHRSRPAAERIHALMSDEHRGEFNAALLASFVGIMSRCSAGDVPRAAALPAATAERR
jgi:HD-GYP domain-containing protein (c-di-GMP phosphodiesterase class II)